MIKKFNTIYLQMINFKYSIVYIEYSLYILESKYNKIYK